MSAAGPTSPSTPASWYRHTPKGWLLDVHVAPGAKKEGIAGIHDGALKVRIASPAIEGRANEALIRFIAKQLSVPKQAVQLVGGETSRRKRLLVSTAADPKALLALVA